MCVKIGCSDYKVVLLNYYTIRLLIGPRKDHDSKYTISTVKEVKEAPERKTFVVK